MMHQWLQVRTHSASCYCVGTATTVHRASVCSELTMNTASQVQCNCMPYGIEYVTLFEVAQSTVVIATCDRLLSLIAIRTCLKGP
eukprot:17643-Heterococcus_DN1.PRE.1